MEILLYICRYFGGILFVVSASTIVIFNQQDSYKKHKLLRKKLSIKQLILKKVCIVSAITGALSWIIAEIYRFEYYFPLVGIIVLTIGSVLSIIFYLKEIQKNNNK